MPHIYSLRETFKKINLLQLIFWFFILFFLGWSLFSLVRRPMLGVGDNSDFWRIIQVVGLKHVVDENIVYDQKLVQPKFNFTISHWKKFNSSAILPAYFARTLHRFFFPDAKYFDLRTLGVIYWCLSFFIILWGIHLQFPKILLILFLWVMIDPVYMLFFNSFYPEGFLFLEYFGFVVLFWKLNQDSKIGKVNSTYPKNIWLGNGLLLGIFSFLTGITKQPYILTPLILWIAVSYITIKTKIPLKIVSIYLWIPLFFSMVFSILFFNKVNQHEDFMRMRKVNNYHVIFRGLAEVSKDPDKVLRDFNFPFYSKEYIGKDFWHHNFGSYSEEFEFSLSNLSRIKVWKYYLLDFKGLTKSLKKVFEKVQNNRDGIGESTNFEKLPSTEKRHYTVLWQFSAFRDGLFRLHPLIFYFLCLVIIVRIGIFYFIKTPRENEIEMAFIFLFLTFLSQIFIVFLGDGFEGLKRHTILARLSLDFLIIFSSVDILESLHLRLLNKLKVVGIGRNRGGIKNEQFP